MLFFFYDYVSLHNFIFQQENFSCLTQSWGSLMNTHHHAGLAGNSGVRAVSEGEGGDDAHPAHAHGDNFRIGIVQGKQLRSKPAQQRAHH